MQVSWQSTAVRDLAEVRAFIAEDNPVAVRQVARRILEAIERLHANPGLGRPGRVMDTRELIVPGTPYLVPYRVLGERIVILRVLHGARLWPERFES